MATGRHIPRVGAARTRGLRAQSSRRLGRTRNERGSYVLEMAFSLTILLALVFGVFEISEALYTYHILSDAAREGTRYAIVRGSACSVITPCPATAANIQSYLQGLGLPGINPNLMTVTTTWPSRGSACTPSTNPCNNPGNLVQVTVTYRFPLSIPFVTASTVTMSSTSEMVISS
jgi:Flp pilus assembly protein TadG